MISCHPEAKQRAWPSIVLQLQISAVEQSSSPSNSPTSELCPSHHIQPQQNLGFSSQAFEHMRNNEHLGNSCLGVVSNYRNPKLPCAVPHSHSHLFSRKNPNETDFRLKRTRGNHETWWPWAHSMAPHLGHPGPIWAPIGGYGCRVIQRLIEYCASVQISALLDEVLQCRPSAVIDMAIWDFLGESLRIVRRIVNLVTWESTG